jgi:hypothetical protein
VDATDHVKDLVVRRGYHISSGDDVFICCLDIEEREREGAIEINDPELVGIFKQATEEKCDYIQLF